MTPHRHWFVSYEPFQTPIRLADEKLIYSAGIGAVDFVPLVDGVAQRPIHFSRVLHVPDLRNNLLSVLFLVRSKCFEIRILGESIRFLLQGELLFTASISNDNAAYLDGYTPKTESSVPLVAAVQCIRVPLDLELWHRRAMHFNPAALKRAMSKNLVSGMSLDSLAKLEAVCIPCLAGKMHGTPFPSTGHSTPDILGLTHMNLVGPMPVCTHSGLRYFVGFHDNASKFHAAYPLHSKDEALDAFVEFKAWAENQTGKSIKAIQDNKGGEFISHRWDNFCSKHGIQRRHTTQNRPQQN